MTNFISDYFTTEEHLLDSLSLIGPTATNIAVTPMMQFYGGGVYDNSEAGMTMESDEGDIEKFYQGNLKKFYQILVH